MEKLSDKRGSALAAASTEPAFWRETVTLHMQDDCPQTFLVTGAVSHGRVHNRYNLRPGGQRQMGVHQSGWEETFQGCGEVEPVAILANARLRREMWFS